jgi:hypothetical protein
MERQSRGEGFCPLLPFLTLFFDGEMARGTLFFARQYARAPPHPSSRCPPCSSKCTTRRILAPRATVKFPRYSSPNPIGQTLLPKAPSLDASRSPFPYTYIFRYTNMHELSARTAQHSLRAALAHSVCVSVLVARVYQCFGTHAHTRRSPQQPNR